VADNLAALDFALKQGIASPDRVAVIGGSHGGFLGTHLIGQAPDRFKTAVLRNPVTSLSSMVRSIEDART
jgi:acylaminoacyl-peptidase